MILIKLAECTIIIYFYLYLIFLMAKVRTPPPSAATGAKFIQKVLDGIQEKHFFTELVPWEHCHVKTAKAHHQTVEHCLTYDCMLYSSKGM